MSKERIVATLPIHPVEDPNLFFMFSPFVADLVAKLIDKPLVLPVNVTGLKVLRLIAGEKETLVRNHKKMLARLGVVPSSFWRDDERDFQPFVSSVVEYLCKSGLVEIKSKQLCYCGCGALELPVNYLNKAREGKIYTLEGGTVKCKVCGQEAQFDERDKSLYLTLPLGQEGPKVCPVIYSNDVRVKLNELSGEEIRISRRHKTDFQFVLEGRSFFIDTDFAWELLGSNFDNVGKAVDSWVVSSRSLRKGVLVALFQELLSNHTATLLVTPYIKNSLKFNSTIDRYGISVVRAFMLGHLEWNKKESETNSSLFYWILRSMEKLPYFQNQPSESRRVMELERFTMEISRKNLEELLKQCRSGKSGTCSLLLSLIMQDEL